MWFLDFGLGPQAVLALRDMCNVLKHVGWESGVDAEIGVLFVDGPELDKTSLEY
jgi:hypothetical protein